MAVYLLCETRTDCEEGIWKQTKVPKDAFTLYTLRKVGDSMYAYINRVQITSFRFQPFTGPNFGIGAGTREESGLVKYDYIMVSYLKQ